MRHSLAILAQTLDEQRTVFELSGMPSGWMRLIGALVLLGLWSGVVWLYRREGRAGAGARVRGVLAVLRCLSILALAIIWLEPVTASYTKRTTRARVAVLVDRSASMGVVDAFEPEQPLTAAPDASRLARTVELLARSDHAWLRKLADRNELALFAFGDVARAVRLPWLPAASAPSQPSNGSDDTSDFAEIMRPTGPSTNFGRALSSILAQSGDAPIAAVVLISDGIVNDGLPPDDLSNLARSLRAPLYAVGVGSEAEPSNLRVTRVTAPSTVAKGDPIELKAELAGTGMDASRVLVEITAREVGQSGGQERVVHSQEVEVGGGIAAGEVRARVPADQAGEFVYRARVAPLPGEAVEFDNAAAASVLVLDDRLRVLLIAGRPTFDYRFVAGLLLRDATIDVSCWLQSADPQAIRDGDIVLEELPRKPEDIFAYDAVILMDPDPREFDSAWSLAARRLVDELGGGLMLQAGPLFTTRFLKDERLGELVAMLPVLIDADADMRLSERGAYQTRAQPLRVQEQSLGHPLLQWQQAAGAGRAVFDSLAGVWWYLPVQREKPLASVLFRAGASTGGDSPTDPVLLAAQPFGAGRVVFLGFDGTWRWRATAEPQLQRFWIQVVRYLSQARRQGVSNRGSIVLDRESYSVGESARIEANLLDSAFNPLSEPTADAVVELAAGEPRAVRLTAIPGRDGWYSGRALLDQDGPAVVRVDLSADMSASRPAPLTKHFQVARPDIELQTLRRRTDTLTRLAVETGGGFETLATAVTLPDRIPDASRSRVIPGPRGAQWDRTWVLMVLAALLGVEWFVRRRNHLL